MYNLRSRNFSSLVEEPKNIINKFKLNYDRKAIHKPGIYLILMKNIIPLGVKLKKGDFIAKMGKSVNQSIGQRILSHYKNDPSNILIHAKECLVPSLAEKYLKERLKVERLWITGMYSDGTRGHEFVLLNEHNLKKIQKIFDDANEFSSKELFSTIKSDELAIQIEKSKQEIEHTRQIKEFKEILMLKIFQEIIEK